MEQYMKNGISTGAHILLTTTSWLAMGNVATKDAFDWAANEPSILVASCIIARLLNDLVSHEVYAYTLFISINVMFSDLTQI